MIACGPGCCPGCQDCYGMSIGCHQSPCRCDKPCTCRWPDEDEDPKWRDSCERHDSRGDMRWVDVDPDYDDVFDVQNVDPCPVCGERGACGADEEGRPLIHSVQAGFDHGGNQ